MSFPSLNLRPFVATAAAALALTAGVAMAQPTPTPAAPPAEPKAGPPPAPAPATPTAAAPGTATPTAAPTTAPAEPPAPAPEPEAPPTAPAPVPPHDHAHEHPERSWMPDIYARSSHAVVRVETATTTGTGFLFVTPRHVATAYHLVKTGRAVHVATLGGERIPAAIVALDPDHDLAILELSKNLEGATPLLPRTDTPRIGEPIIVIGHPLSPDGGQRHAGAGPFAGLLDWSMTAGVLGSINETQVQLDAAVNPGSSGGPVLDAEGRVVGVITGKLVGGMTIEGLGFATRGTHLASLQKRASQSRTEYTGDVSLGFGGGFQVFGGPWGMGGGLVAGLSLKFWDVIGLRGHFLLGWGDDNYYGTEVVDRDFFRYGWDALLEYRLAARVGGNPFLLTLGGGVSMIFDEVDELVAEGSVDGSTCGPTERNCPVALSFSERELDRDQFMTGFTVGLADTLRFLWMFDPEDVGDNYVLTLMFGMNI